MKNLLNFIFELKKTTPSHISFRILGIKFNYLKQSIKKERKEISKYYKTFKDASLIPKAEGNLRLIQEANMAFLKMFDKMCKENDLKYWIDFGTLLGAIRHKGFIPWDDDIDIAMIREDYEKLIEKFSDGFDKYPELKLVFENNKKNKCFIKLACNSTQNLFIDIFPYDFYYKNLNDEEKTVLTQKIISIRKSKLNKKFKTVEKIRDYFKKITKEFILENQDANNQNGAIFMGIDFPHNHKIMAMDYDVIFPLKYIEFENTEFLAPNKPKKVLEALFGNYMKIPKDSYPRHSDYTHISNEEKILLENFIKKEKI